MSILTFFLLIILTTIPYAASLNFNFSNISSKDYEQIVTGGEAYVSDHGIQLTPELNNGEQPRSASGRARYTNQFHLWNKTSKELTSFSTSFSFVIRSMSEDRAYGDGLTFFLAESNPMINGGGAMGLPFNTTANVTIAPFVAVEFDTFSNADWDPMRLKKQKRHRRSVRFYTTCFGFRPPFKILCDGTFIHHLLVNRITPADTALSNILGAPVKLFTTRCVLAELKSLGEAYSDSINVARDLAPARCDHEKRKSAVACLTEVIGEENSEHFFVASQDADLRKKFQEIPAVPVVFALRNALFLEPPSQSQQQFAKSAEEQRSHMNELEFTMLLNKKKRSSDDGELGEASDGDEVVPDKIIEDLRKNAAKRKTDVKDPVPFKRKKAKGPNPLSCKKKKNVNQKPVANKESNDNSETIRSRSKKRKRSRKQKSLTEATD